MDDILKHQEDIKNNILKSFQVDLQKSEENDIEKARSGVYADTAENRKLNRVGKQYGHAGKEDESKGRQAGKENETESSKDKKSIDEHAKNTSDETLKKVSENEKAPEDLRNAAKKELKNRNAGSKKTKTVDRFNVRGELDEEHPDNKRMWELEEKVDSSSATPDELQEFVNLRSALTNYSSLQHFKDELQRRKDDLKEYNKTGDSEKFAKKYVHLLSGYGDDAGENSKGNKLRIGDIRTERKYSNGDDIVEFRGISHTTRNHSATESGFEWYSAYKAAESIKYSLEYDIKERMKKLRQVEKILN